MKNNRLKNIIFFLFFTITTIAFSQQKKYISYTVKQGETIRKIAKRYNLSTRDLLRLNPGVRRRPKPNTVIIVPNANYKEEVIVKEEIAEEKKTNDTQKKYIVLPKDTLFGISKKYNITIEQLVEANPQIKEGLKPDMELIIPENKEEVKFELHTVEKGDTVYNITKRYGITIQEFYTLNPKALEGLPIKMVVKIKPKKITEDVTEAEEVLEVEEIQETKNTAFIENINFQKPLQIAVMLPYQLQKFDKATSKNFEENKLLAITTDFHLGIQMAIDSLHKKGLPIKVKYFDTQNSTSKINKIISTNDFSNYNAVIGPLFFDKAHYVASKTNTPIIAPMYSKRQNNLSNQSNLIKIGVGAKTKEEVLLNYMKKNYNGENIVVISDTKPKNQSKLWQTVNKLKQFDSIQKIAVIKPEKGYIDGRKIRQNLIKSTVNWVILVSDDNVTTSAGVNNLKSFITDYKLKLFSFDKGSNFDKIDNSFLGKLHFVYPTTSCLLDYNEETKQFINKYQEKNNTLPSEYSFRGFDITYDILTRLASATSGVGLNLGKSTRLTTFFNYEKEFLGGYANKGVFLVEYNPELKPIILENLPEENKE